MRLQKTRLATVEQGYSITSLAILGQQRSVSAGDVPDPIDMTSRSHDDHP